MLDDEELWKKLGEFGFDPAPPEGDILRPQEGIVPLGHDRGIYYYLSRSTGQVEAIPAASHTRAMLAHLASEAHYWERSIHAGEKGVNWNAAADDLRVKCRAIGVYDPDRVRGRGAWLDDGRPVLHLGDRILVDGQELPLALDDSRYVYEAGRRMNVPLADPLTAQEASRLMDLCMCVSWRDRESMGRLFAGWLVVASVCGAMPWRPHIWITSGAGAGKSWLLSNVVKPVLGPLAVFVQGKTTEPALRALLQTDARPVIFDEAESQNQRDAERIQHVLDLARQASTEDGPEIVKGARPGEGVRPGGCIRYRIRSCFAFASINVGLLQAADESRTTILEIEPPNDRGEREADFAKLKQAHAALMTPDFGARLLARTIRLIPVIRENAEIFAQAIARHTGSRRTGDTLGVMLAGFWSLRSSKIATVADADLLVGGREWVRTATEWQENEPEWQRAASVLAQSRERVVNSNGRTDEIPLWELLECDTNPGASTLYRDDVTRALARMGMRIADVKGVTSLLIANRSKACERAFSGTPWASGWLGVLARTPDARRNYGPVRIGGSPTKCLALPLSRILSHDA